MNGSFPATPRDNSIVALHNSSAAQAHEQFLKLAQSSLALQTQALLEQQRLITLLSGTEVPRAAELNSSMPQNPFR